MIRKKLTKAQINSRRIKENAYRRYKRAFTKKVNSLIAKGLTPRDAVPLSRSEYRANRKALIKEGEKKVTNKIIQTQLYKFSYKTAVLLRKEGKERKLDWSSQSIQKIRTGENFDLDFLSFINNELKISHPDWDSYDRRDYIEKEWFGYAS